MVYYFYLNKYAYDAVISQKKTVEIRLKGEKEIKQGDYIVFSEHKGFRKVCVRVDDVLCFDCIYDLMMNTEKGTWSFSPESVCNQLIQKEFFTYNRSNESVLAISFSLPEISVVLPVHNAGCYLEDTFETLSKQIYKSFEIIVVDDGSSDNSGIIIGKYDNVLPIALYRNKENRGAAFSRNLGLTLANGSFVIFLDSDDLFDPELLLQLIIAIKKYNADISLAEFDSFTGDHYALNIRKDEPIEKSAFDMSLGLVSYDDIPNSMRYLLNVPWNKLFKKEFLIDNHLEFQDLTSSNDVFFCNIAMILGKTIHVETSKALIHYRVFSKNGISTSRDPFNEHKAYVHLAGQLKSRGIPLSNRILDNYLYGLFHYIHSCDREYKEDYLLFVKNIILYGNEILPRDYIKNNHPYAAELFQKYTINSPFFSLKLEVIEILFDKQKILKKTENITKIGIFKSRDIYEAFVLLFENDFESITIVDSLYNVQEYILSFSKLQTNDISIFLSANRLDSVKIIEVYDK